MKLRGPFVTKTCGLVGSAAIRAWMSTLDYRGVFYDESVDPVNPACRRQGIYVFWHEYILFPIYCRGHCDLSILISQHGDAEILSRAASHLGFHCVRGSTTRGGVAALRELVARAGSMHLAITPDGPRGPRRVLAQGPVYLASKLGMPLIAMGLGYDRPWRAKSWDRFAVPRPWSRARAVVSPPLELPRDLDREGIEHYRQEAERMLNRLTREAEAWAESGSTKLGEIAGRREHLHSRRSRVDTAHLRPARPRGAILPAFDMANG